MNYYCGYQDYKYEMSYIWNGRKISVRGLNMITNGTSKTQSLFNSGTRMKNEILHVKIPYFSAVVYLGRLQNMG